MDNIQPLTEAPTLTEDVPTPPQVRFENVSYSYYTSIDDDEDDYDSNMPTPQTIHYALSDVSVSINSGEFIAVIGRNGSGKSTMARLMNALLLPTDGTVFVDGISTLDDDMLWEIRSNIGMVFQNPDNQIIGATVEEDVAFGLENLGVPRDEMLKRIEWATQTVGIAEQHKVEPHLLSGGQKQRVAIAGILAMQPKCIVLDEATAMLDPIGRREVMNVVRKLNRENGITIIHITHHMDEVSLCDRVILIDDGRLEAESTPREIFTKTALLKRCGLEAPQVTRLFRELIESGVDVPADVITPDEARGVLEKLFRDRNVQSTPADMERREKQRLDGKMQEGRVYSYHEGAHSLRVENISYTYGIGTPFEKKALGDVSFDIGDGEFVGIIGHTGCGKSTLVQHLNGLLKPDSGSVSIGGSRMDGANMKEMRKRVGLVFQYPEYQLFETTVAKDIAFGLKAEKLDEEETRRRVEEAADIVGLDREMLDKSIYDLSGGQKRRAAIAGVIVMKPQILVLDEPAAGLDPAGRDDILRFAHELRSKQGITVVLVSHSMEDVARLCDKVIVMNGGTVEMSGTPAEVFEHEQRLRDIGLSAPQLSTLFHALDEALPDVCISRSIYTIEDGVDEIMSLLSLK